MRRDLTSMVTLDEGGAGAQLLAMGPCEGAGGHVAELWWVQRGIGERCGADWRIVPDTHPHLIHCRTRDGRTRTSFVGARSRYVDVEQADRAFTVGVRLRPGSLPTLTGLSAWDLRDRSVLATAVAPRRAARWLDALEAETSPARVRAALLRFLGSWAGSTAIDWRAAAFADRVLSLAGSPGAARAPVRTVTDDLGMSERLLRDVCRESLGLRPKEVHRIARLHRAIAAGLAGLGDAAVAAAVGYADQSHMIRDHKALLGATPERFRARGRGDPSSRGRCADRCFGRDPAELSKPRGGPGPHRPGCRASPRVGACPIGARHDPRPHEETTSR